MSLPKRSGEYDERGDYHRDLDPNWSYAPIYKRKVALVNRFVSNLPPGSRLLDVGAGEGVLVERYKKQGLECLGVDAYFESEEVKKADLKELPFEDGAFDAAVCLDVLEHLSILDQPVALQEIKRVLGNDGRFLMSIPNLAHLHSRLRFMFMGRLTRTSAVERHPGDRPVAEVLELLSQSGFRVVSRRGIFPTFPILFRLVNRHPARWGWMVAVLDRLFPFPGTSFLNVIEARSIPGATSVTQTTSS